MEEDVSKSDIVFLAMVFDEAVLDIVERYSTEGKAFLILASVGEGMKLARLGKFSVGDVVTSFADSKVARVFKLLKGLTGKSSSMEVRKMLSMADTILKVLKFGKWKDAYNYVQAWKYFFHGGRENILNMFLMVLSEYYGFKTEYNPPTEIPGFYIAHPRTDKNGTPKVDAIISFLYFRLEGGPLGGNYEAFEQLCKQMNIPLINYVCMGYSTQEDWRERAEGLFPMETNLCIILPELDGLIEGVLVSGGIEPPKKGRDMVRIMAPIEERVNHAVARTANWIKLKYKDNKDKKVAFILFNYPPGKDTIGSAGNLDTFESLIHLLDRMREEGYTVSGYPRTRHEFIRLITKKNVVNQSNWTSIAKVKDNSFKISLSEYREWFSELPEKCREEMVESWGDPPGSLMADEEYLYVPGLQFGNIFIGFQPERGAHADPSKTPMRIPARPITTRRFLPTTSTMPSIDS
jgi:cobalamin biosynthesis Mg chelatase CobN